MCGRRDASLVLDDIVAAATRLTELGEHLPVRGVPDRDTADMVLWNLTVLGEAAKRLESDVRSRFAGVAWSAMAGTRDVVVHHYEGVDWEIVTRVVREDLPAVLPELTAIRDQLRTEYDREPE